MKDVYAFGCETVIYSGREDRLPVWSGKHRVSARSTAKLIQVLPVYLLGIDRKYALNHRELAILSASHLGQDVQMRALNSLMEKLGFREDQMCIPAAAPAGRLARQYWLRRGGRPGKLYNPCAGNHLAMMAIQRELTGDAAGYTNFSSAAQTQITELARQIYGMGEPPELLRDSCGAPTYLVPLPQIAVAYQNLSAPSAYLPHAVAGAIRRNYDILKENPLFLEGDGCLSTILTAGREIVAKTGAGGLLAIGIRDLGCGIAIQSRQHDFASVAQSAKLVLSRLGYRNPSLEAQLTAIARRRG